VPPSLILEMLELPLKQIGSKKFYGNIRPQIWSFFFRLYHQLYSDEIQQL